MVELLSLEVALLPRARARAPSNGYWIFAKIRLYVPVCVPEQAWCTIWKLLSLESLILLVARGLAQW